MVDSASQLPTSCTLMGNPSLLVPNRIEAFFLSNKRTLQARQITYVLVVGGCSRRAHGLVDIMHWFSRAA